MKQLMTLVILIAAVSISCSKKNMANSTGNVPDASFTNTRWKLVKLPGTVIPELRKDAFITFATENNRAFGSGGCNNMNGGYKLDGNKLKIGPMASTMMACTQEIMQLEDNFSKMLIETDNYIISGDKMQLRKGENVLAEFEALYLK